MNLKYKLLKALDFTIELIIPIVCILFLCLAFIAQVVIGVKEGKRIEAERQATHSTVKP